MREAILDALVRGERILADGSFGIYLSSKGLPAGMMPEAWILSHPDEVRAVHREYVEAGAQLITTDTLGGNRIRLGEADLAGDGYALNRRAAELAREAAGEDVWVAGSMGPTGRLMAPYGELTVAEAEALFAEQAEALAEGGVDCLLVETHYDIEEAATAVRVARERTGLPVFGTFAFNRKGRTMMGLKPDEAARRVREAGGSVVGANCGDGPEAVAAALRGMQGVTELPLMAKANAGIPRLEQGNAAHWDVTVEAMAGHALAFAELGARIIGGCCGTRPDYIRAMARSLAQAQ